MVQLVKRRVQKVQLTDISIEFLCRFYVDQFNINSDIILLIYNQDEYFTNIAYTEVTPICTDDDFIYFLFCIGRNKSVKKDNDSLKNAKRILDNVGTIQYVYVEDSIDEENAMFYTDDVLYFKEYAASFIMQRNLLRKEGICAYLLRVPELDDLEETMRHPECIITPFLKIQWAEERKDKMLQILKCLTDLGYDAAKEKMLNWGEKTKTVFGGGAKTIYLVGACIVGAYTAFPDDDLVANLYEKLMDLGLDYTIVRVSISRDGRSNFNAILEKDINNNDIVIFITDHVDRGEADIDLDDIYNNYRGEKWLFTDLPIHVTGIGIDLIADEIIKKIIAPVTETCDKLYNGSILHKGRKQLTYDESIIVEQYLERLKQYSRKPYDTVGACIMTCNPFTKGHYHLIECASKQVDCLYVFVVGEDNFWISFEDRIEMVRRGTAALNNVVVLPSSIMISRATFVNYFEKEIKQDVIIDAEKDIMIFRDYVAPTLGISKRFVGEEPSDNITRQYNQLLKRDLGDVIEVVEIPRKTTEGENEVISASSVRHYCEIGDWDRVEEMVPRSTSEYLRQNRERFYDRSNSNVNKIIKFILQHDHIVICGLGEDAQKLIKQLNNKLDARELEKLEYYDKKANQQEYRYCDKKVIGFEELVNKYKDYYMLIATRKYKQDLFCSLVNNNINIENILVIS